MIDEPLSREIKSARRDGPTLPVIITMRSTKDVAALVARGIKPNHTFENIPSCSADLTPEQIEEIDAMPQVELIELDTRAEALPKH